MKIVFCGNFYSYMDWKKRKASKCIYINNMKLSKIQFWKKYKVKPTYKFGI